MFAVVVGAIWFIGWWLILANGLVGSIITGICFGTVFAYVLAKLNGSVFVYRKRSRPRHQLEDGA